MNASPVGWQRKNDGSLRLGADFRILLNDKIMTENYPLPDTETLIHELEGCVWEV